jgi:Ca2+-binding EF-hand superfamily protein
MKDTEFLLMILEKPNSKKPYVDFKNFLINCGKLKEAQAIEHLIQKKFNVSDNSNNNKKQ